MFSRKGSVRMWNHSSKGKSYENVLCGFANLQLEYSKHPIEMINHVNQRAMSVLQMLLQSTVF